MEADLQPAGRFSRAPGAGVFVAFGGVLALVAAVVIMVIVTNRPATGDVGRLLEASVEVPSDVALPQLSDVTAQWNLDDLDIVPAADQMAGGVAVANLGGTEVPELTIANGDVVVLGWDGERYGSPVRLAVAQAIGVTASDVDGDGFADLLIATASDSDYIVWGGQWVDGNSEPAISELSAVGQSSGLLAAELSGDNHVDIVRLGRGMTEPVPDILWLGEGGRAFRSTELPIPDRFTLAGEIVDADGDGLLDIWLTRDVGWARGGDTVLSRQGDPGGAWVDIADQLGVALEIDGMGITIADLNGDAQLDAYVSDLGDNEQLLGSETGFTPIFDTGAAHIRPVGAPGDIVSSTWGTGALDINLDGVLDLVLGSGGFPVGTIRNKIDDTSVAVEEPPAMLIGLGDGTFADVWSQLGIDSQVVARGLAVADLDRDGDDDVLVVDRRGEVLALRNDTLGPTFTVLLGADCQGASGRVVTITTSEAIFQRLLAPHGYASSHAAEVIVGVPDSTGASPRVEITGPFQRVIDQTQRVALDRPIRTFAC